jgi:5-methyltetrahydrofolate--homocysteine methyltransferase
MAIANPSQDLLVNTALAADLLLGEEGAAERYIDRVTTRPMTITTGQESGRTQQIPEGQNTSVQSADHKNMDGKKSEKTEEDIKAENKQAVYQAVVKGNKKNILSFVEKALADGTKPDVLIDETLIPAINEVGRLYDKQIYFLPQLISGAEAMKSAIDYLESLLQKGDRTKARSTVIIATVAGDIHDIGKNLVSLMLKNYGFRVIDLGKDVPTQKILQTAKEENADIIALSALMTTTMTEMKNVVELAREQGVRAKIIIGGAVVTESYQKEIGADGYSEDAQSAVALVRKLTKK